MSQHNEGELPRRANTDGLTDVLQKLQDVRSDLDSLEFAVIAMLRAQKISWQEIGDALNISRQAAKNRFSHPKPRRHKS